MATNKNGIRGSVRVGDAMYLFMGNDRGTGRYMYRHTAKMDKIADTPIACLEAYCSRHGNFVLGGGLGEYFCTPSGRQIACEVLYDKKQGKASCVCVLWKIGSYDIITHYWQMFAYCCRSMVMSLGLRVERVIAFPMPTAKALEVRIEYSDKEGIIMPFSRYGFL